MLGHPLLMSLINFNIWKSTAIRHRTVPLDARNKVYFNMNPKIV